ncbi:MAG: hypothetical protein WC465_02160 [Patescibacteria group bacterium]
MPDKKPIYVSSTPPKSSSSGPIVLIAIIVALLVGGGVYYWQNMEARKLIKANEEKIRTEMQNKLNAAENQITKLTNKLSENENKLTELEKNQTINNLCTAAPTPTEAGYNIYPIDTKYESLRHLGELFTASDCGDADRLSKIFGVSGENYTLGANISLNNNPSTDLQTTFKQIGFQCIQKNTANASCKQWQLKNTVKVIDILKLKPFYQELQSYDCINCG